MNKLSQEEFEALFDNAAMGIVTVNPRGEIVMVNQFGLRQFGYERVDVLGQKIEKLIPTKYRERHVRHRSDYQEYNPHQRPIVVGLNLWAQRKDGSEFPVEVSLSNYQNSEGTFSIAFIIDITVRKASEDALLRLNDELERKVEARTHSLREALEREQELGELKSRFVSMASHEFRTPLSTILSSAYLITQYKTTDEQPRREKHIQRIISSVNMLTSILNDFLSVGKIEEGGVQVRLVEVQIRDWMQEVISELEHLLKAGQQIVYAYLGDNEFLTDPTLLRHIVQNLVANAIKFSPEESVICLQTNLTGGNFVLSVSDSGIGISPEDQQHLFERFFRGANAINIEGTGLGLHIVGKYAELMNGKVSIRSAVGRGTTVNVTFTPSES